MIAAVHYHESGNMYNRIVPAVLVAMIGLTLVLTGCGTDPPMPRETASVTTDIIRETYYGGCTISEPIEETLTAKLISSSETSWTFEGKTTIGGNVDIAWWIPSFNIETSMSARYGQRTLESWEETRTKKFEIKPGTLVMYVAFWRQVHRLGEIEVDGKLITYDYPERPTLVADEPYVVPCQRTVFLPACISSSGAPSIDPVIRDLEGVWRVTDNGPGEITQIEIVFSDPRVVFHVLTNGVSGPPDWGEAYACHWTRPIRVYFDFGYKTVTLTVQDLSGGKLTVQTVERYAYMPLNVNERVRVYTLE